MKIAILEDEKEVSDKIQHFINKYFGERGVAVDLAVYSNAYDLLEGYRADTEVLFMDIQLGLMTGMEAAVKIREIDPHVLIVFITNLAQYAVEGYSVNAFDFILKPVEYNGFAMRLERICNELKHRNPENFINLKAKSGFIRLNVADILYVEVKAHDLIYHTAGESIVVRGTMKSVTEELCKYYFSLCNSCYLVNLAHVKKISKSVILSNGQELLISQGKRKQFMTELAKYIGETI